MPVKINPDKKYFLREILKLGLIPSVQRYDLLYNRVTKSMSIDGVSKPVRRVRIITDHEGMKAGHDGSPWRKIQGKIWVAGEEIIKFNKIVEEFSKSIL